MRLNRGCGCLIFVLAAVNLVFCVLEIVAIFMDVEPVKPRTVTLLLWVGIFAANAVVCVLFGLRALRRPGDETDAPIEEWTDDDRPD
jgi:hypothetical protein